MINSMSITRFFSLLLCFSFSLGSLFSCEQNNEVISPATEESTEEQAVEIITTALSMEAQGLSASAPELVDLSDNYQNAASTSCGNAIDSLIQFNRNTDRLTADYTIALNWTPICGQGGLVRSIAYTRNTNGTYTTQRMESDDNATVDWFVDNILTGTSLVVNGSYQRNGTQQITTARATRTYNSTVNFTIENLNINKGTRRIESGQATFTLTATGSGEQNIDFDGSVLFLGDGAAILIINGNQYEINL